MGLTTNAIVTRVSVAMNRRGEQAQHDGEHECAGCDVPVAAANHENCRGQHGDHGAAGEGGRERREVAQLPRNHEEEDHAQPDRRGHALAHMMVVHGFRKQAEHEATEPLCRGWLRVSRRLHKSLTTP